MTQKQKELIDHIKKTDMDVFAVFTDDLEAGVFIQGDGALIASAMIVAIEKDIKIRNFLMSVLAEHLFDDLHEKPKPEDIN